MRKQGSKKKKPRASRALVRPKRVEMVYVVRDSMSPDDPDRRNTPYVVQKTQDLIEEARKALGISEFGDWPDGRPVAVPLDSYPEHLLSTIDNLVLQGHPRRNEPAFRRQIVDWMLESIVELSSTPPPTMKP